LPQNGPPFYNKHDTEKRRSNQVGRDYITSGTPNPSSRPRRRGSHRQKNRKTPKSVQLGLALVLRRELRARLEAKGWQLEWDDAFRDLDNLLELGVTVGAEGYLIRSEIKGHAGNVAQAAGVVLPPSIRPC